MMIDEGSRSDINNLDIVAVFRFQSIDALSLFEGQLDIIEKVFVHIKSCSASPPSVGSLFSSTERSALPLLHHSVHLYQLAVHVEAVTSDQSDIKRIIHSIFSAGSKS